MGRITRPQRNWQYLQQQPELADEAIIIPTKKRVVDPEAEWRLQVKCVKAVRARMAVDKSLRFIAPMAEGIKDKKRAGIAKMMGLQSGVFDIWLLRHGKIYPVELKRRGGKLSTEQHNWWSWLSTNGFPCWKCETLEEFMKVLDMVMA